MTNISSNYLGVKISDTTANYFSNATEHFANAGQAAADCTVHATKTAFHGAQVAGQAFWRFGAFRVITTEVMTGNAFLWTMPPAAKAVVSGLAGLIYNQAPLVMGACVGLSIASKPEDALECVKNAIFTGIDAANFVYENTAGIANGVAGLGHLVYDNLPSYHEEVSLAGNDDLAISWVGAVA
ncbi:MAG TPA: hypothetical protein LFW21_02885 [Rickettsia endosymbiont of Pyrocoelia pectoralis]|nr:hypothetical protein [Rickettsia endosymbiont of Pyrocoelia pectoralis]